MPNNYYIEVQFSLVDRSFLCSISSSFHLGIKMKDTIVLYPAPGMGHVLSMVELGKLILRRHNTNFAVNILVTTGFLDNPSADSYLHSVSKAHPSIAFHRFPRISADTSPPEPPRRRLRIHPPQRFQRPSLSPKNLPNLNHSRTRHRLLLHFGSSDRRGNRNTHVLLLLHWFELGSSTIFFRTGISLGAYASAGGVCEYVGVIRNTTNFYKI